MYLEHDKTHNCFSPRACHMFAVSVSHGLVLLADVWHSTNSQGGQKQKKNV